MNSKIRKYCFPLLSLFLGISFVIRCKPTMFYVSKYLEYIFVFLLLTLTVWNYLKTDKKNEVNVDLHEFLYLFLPVFFIFTPLNKYIIFYVISIVYYFLLQSAPKNAKLFFYPLLIFSIITSIVSWIAALFPNFYINNILSIFNDISLSYSFLNKGMNHGLTTHYSRNSLYITMGIFILFCKIISSQGKLKNRNTLYFLLIFLLATQFLVAKRGLTIFMFAAMGIILLSREKGFKNKIKKFGKYILIGGLTVLIVSIFLPQVSNVFVRFLSMFKSGDVSTGRFGLYSIAIKMFLKSPIIGCGWGSFLEIVAGTTFQAVHNDYLQALGEIGIIGFLIMFIPNFVSIFKSWKYFKEFRSSNRKLDNNYLYLYLISLMIQIFLLLYSLTGYPHYSYEQVLLYFVACGIAAGIRKNNLIYAKNKINIKSRNILGLVCNDSKNYANQLQTFAMVKTLKDFGCNYKLIQYNKKASIETILQSILKIFNIYYIKYVFNRFKSNKLEKKYLDIFTGNILRNKKYFKFSDKYLDNKVTYYGWNDLVENTSVFKCLMCSGSGIWHPTNLESHFYTLEFAIHDCKKIAYSTSFGVSKIPFYQKSITKQYLNQINNISIQDEETEKNIKTLCNKNLNYTCPPELLLSSKEWKNVIRNKKIIHDKYIFCYFLTENQLYRKVAKTLSRKTGYKIVFLPHILKVIESDINFGDYQLFDIDSFAFFNLVRNSEYVLTDTSIGVTLSLINKKKFIVFNEKSNELHNNRNEIDYLLMLLELIDRNYNKDVNILTQIDKKLDYKEIDDKIDTLRDNSKRFLKKSLK